MAKDHFIEEGQKLSLDWSKLRNVLDTGEEILPVVVQDAETKDVLTLAYVNPEALGQTLKTQKATFYSTSRKKLWVKGETSGDVLYVKEVRVNCEQNSLLFLVVKGGQGACHTKNRQGISRQTCFYRKLLDGENLIFLEDEL